jgi:hypothetical protein
MSRSPVWSSQQQQQQQQQQQFSFTANIFLLFFEDLTFSLSFTANFFPFTCASETNKCVDILELDYISRYKKIWENNFFYIDLKWLIVDMFIQKF